MPHAAICKFDVECLSGEALLDVSRAGCRGELSVDGRHTASIATSESIDLYLEPGEHLLLAKVGGLGQVFAATTVNIPSKFPIYRIDMTDSDIKLQPSIE
jgi:hypothetical protein